MRGGSQGASLGAVQGFEEAVGVGTPVLEEGLGLVVDGGAQGCVGEEGVEEEFGEEGGAVDEG